MNELIDNSEQILYERAKAARENAYVPYSHFKVGAALQTKSGQIFTGVNIENASYGLTNCAERSCIFNYVSAGEIADPIVKFLVIGETPAPISPCGACRQVMAEFLQPDTQLILTNLKAQAKRMTLEELLPYYFKKEDLN